MPASRRRGVPRARSPRRRLNPGPVLTGLALVAVLSALRPAFQSPEQFAVVRRLASPSAGAAAGARPPLEGPSAQRRIEEVAGDARPSLVLRAPGAWRLPLPRRGSERLSFSWAVLEGAGAVELSVASDPGAPPLLADRAQLGEPWRETGLSVHGLEALELRLEGGPALVALGAPVLLGPRPRLPNVIVYLVDCLRADHLGAWGYPRPTSPAIDALAADGVVFENATSCAGWTMPSVGCLFTGQYPPVHGAETLEDVLRPDLPTLAERFQRGGYATAAWSANPLVSAQTFGLARGFDRMVGLADPPSGSNPNDIEADAAHITEPVVAWLRANRERRFFLYLHSLDLHASYRRRPPFGSVFLSPERTGPERLLDLYDNELAYNDREIGRLVAALRELGLYDETLIAVVSDHGEEFGEHGSERHGRSLYQQLLHVPLVLKLPGSAERGRRVRDLVSLVDLGPTLLELAGAPRLNGARGRSLAELTRGGASLPERPAFAGQWPMYAVRGPRYKLVETPLPLPSTQLFDLVRDPGELHDLAPEREALARQMRAAVAPLVEASLAGYQLVFAPDGLGGRIALRLSAGERIGALRRAHPRSSDALRLDAAGRQLEVEFDADQPRHFVLRPSRGGVALEVLRDGRPVLGAGLRLGPGGDPARDARVLLDESRLSLSLADLAELLARPEPGLRVLYVAGPAAERAAIDPLLEQKLRALGYVQ